MEPIPARLLGSGIYIPFTDCGIQAAASSGNAPLGMVILALGTGSVMKNPQHHHETPEESHGLHFVVFLVPLVQSTIRSLLRRDTGLLVFVQHIQSQLRRLDSIVINRQYVYPVLSVCSLVYWGRNRFAVRR